MKFQFDDDNVDYFELAPVAYAPALGDVGMAAYRKRLAEVEARLRPRPSPDERSTSGHSHEWFTLYRLADRRLARMRELSGGTDSSADVHDFIAELRDIHRRRPRLQQEFDRAGLP